MNGQDAKTNEPAATGVDRSPGHSADGEADKRDSLTVGHIIDEADSWLHTARMSKDPGYCYRKSMRHLMSAEKLLEALIERQPPVSPG